MERHLEPLAIAANITQAAHCRLDTVLLTFGSLVARYRAMTGPEDATAHTAILNSLEKRWLAADQEVFIATVIVNPIFQASPFAPGTRFIVARIKTLLSSLYTRFFKSDPPNAFYEEVHDYLTKTGRYSGLESICYMHIAKKKDAVRFYRFQAIKS
jgi:hypothetical protein